MSNSPHLVVNGKAYFLDELENLINNYTIWQEKYYLAKTDLDKLNEKNNSLWADGYKAGLEDARFLIKQQLDKQQGN